MSRNYIKQLRAIMDAESMSQGELADQLGVTFASLNRWLNGRVVPRPKRQQQIAHLYQMLVGLSGVTLNQVKEAIIRAKDFKQKDIWTLIERTSELRNDLILEHTYHSTTIEGTTFTKRETEAVLFDKCNVQDKSLVEHLEVVNYATVLRDIFEGKHGVIIDEALIKQIHKSLMQGIREDAGEYSSHQRAIRGVDMMLTHPKDIPEEMGRLLSGWNQKKRKDIRDIAQFHSDFELIHPFGDGNGRVGRLLMVLQCRVHQYTPVIIENDCKIEYYEVLEFAQRKHVDPLVLFLVKEMQRTFKIVKKYTP